MMRLIARLLPTTSLAIKTIGILTIILGVTTVQATPLKAVENFENLAKAMQQKNKPLLLAFEAEHCNYCARLKSDHLQPMENNEDYRSKVMIRTLEYDSSHDVTGFDGETLSANAFSSQYKIRVTPTLIFLNAEGEEIAERILGYNSPDYYGYYLDKAIDVAAKKMKDTE